MILASQSPRRRHLLKQMGYTFDVVPAHIDETARDDERPEALVRRLAVTKAVSVGQRHPSAIVIGSDTVVALGRTILGKPNSPEEAADTLRQLSGRTHQVYTGVALWRGAENKGYVSLAVSQVTFRSLSALEIKEYVESGEPMDKAGAYAIQGHAGKWVDAYVGNLETVIGLPTDVVAALLRHWHISPHGQNHETRA